MLLCMFGSSACILDVYLKLYLNLKCLMICMNMVLIRKVSAIPVLILPYVVSRYSMLVYILRNVESKQMVVSWSELLVFLS